MKFGHHVVMAMQREQAFWWPWVSVPHIAPPTTRMFKEALMAMVVALNFVQFGSKLSKKLSPYPRMLSVQLAERIPRGSQTS